MIIKSDLVAESPMPVRPRSVLTRQPAPQTATPGLDERVVILIVGLAIGFLAGDLLSVLGDEADPKATLLLIAFSIGGIGYVL